MIRPRELRRARRAWRQRPIAETVSASWAVVFDERSLPPHPETDVERKALDALFEERDLLCLGFPSSAEQWRVIDGVRS